MKNKHKKLIYVGIGVAIVAFFTFVFISKSNPSFLSSLISRNSGITLSAVGISNGQIIPLPTKFTYSIVNNVQNISALQFTLSVTNLGTCPVSVTLQSASPSVLQTAFPNVNVLYSLSSVNAQQTWPSSQIATIPLSNLAPNNVPFSAVVAVTYTAPTGVQCKLAEDGSTIANGQTKTFIKTANVTYEIDYDQATGSTSVGFVGSTSTASVTSTTTTATIPTTTTTTTSSLLASGAACTSGSQCASGQCLATYCPSGSQFCCK